MFQKYPYTDYHELNLDYIMKLARESMGLHLDVSGNELLLKNDLNETLSHVVIAYADKALYDNEGNEISAYIINAGRDGRAIAFTKGNGDVVSVALPDDAIYDKNGKEITSYIAKVDVAGNKLRVTDGDGSAYTFTCPYSTSAGKATTDDNGKNLTTYVADINVSGSDIVVKDGEGNVLRTFTVAYATNTTNAEKATKDGDGDVIKSTYGAELIVDGTKIGLEAKDGTTLNKITVPFATLATDATNAIESVTVTGNQLQFRTFGGVVTNITVPYALKATNDGANNEIIKSYVADVTNDALTGKITFLAKDGSTIAELIPTVDSAVHDSYDNLIADFVKTIAVSAGSDYVTVTHGTGTTDTLLIDYANRAWKDTNGNIIKNVYLKSLECLPDSDTGHYVLVGYNGENSEILRIEIYAYMAQRAIGDEDGNSIKSSYVASGAMNGSNLELKAKDNSVLSTIQLPGGGDVQRNYYDFYNYNYAPLAIKERTSQSFGTLYDAKDLVQNGGVNGDNPCFYATSDNGQTLKVHTTKRLESLEQIKLTNPVIGNPQSDIMPVYGSDSGYAPLYIVKGPNALNVNAGDVGYATFNVLSASGVADISEIRKNIHNIYLGDTNNGSGIGRVLGFFLSDNTISVCVYAITNIQIASSDKITIYCDFTENMNASNTVGNVKIGEHTNNNFGIVRQVFYVNPDSWCNWELYASTVNNNEIGGELYIVRQDGGYGTYLNNYTFLIRRRVNNGSWEVPEDWAMVQADDIVSYKMGVQDYLNSEIVWGDPISFKVLAD